MALRDWTILGPMLAACVSADGDPAVQRLVEDPDRGVLTLADLRGPPAMPGEVPDFDVPDTIDVWRKSIDGASYSCDGIIETIDFEDYVRGVLPQEWIRSWEDESLRAGAVAIRTYAAWWVNAGGKYDCADIDDTTSSQVYDDDRYEETDDAVDDTYGVYVIEGDSLVFAEYSAENGDPTAYGVSEPHCTGEDVYGHGRGTCQWGTQRWALYDGMTFDWMAEHYYPDSHVVWPWEAESAEITGPSELVEGGLGEISVEFLNLGTGTWRVGEVFLSTGGESPFAVDGDWVSSSTPATVDGDAPMGEHAAFAFPIGAPSVDADTSLDIELTLERDGAAFGPTVIWTVLVTDDPDGYEDPPDTGSDPGPPGDGGDDHDPPPGAQGPGHLDTYGPGQRVLPGGCATVPVWPGLSWVVALAVGGRRRCHARSRRTPA